MAILKRVAMRRRPKWAVSLKAGIAEWVATTLFVFIGTGTATTFSARASSSLAFTRQPVVSSDNLTSSLQELNDRLQINGSWGVMVALAFGLAITVLAYATAHTSGGQLNPAVSLALCCVGALPPAQTVLNVIAQIVGAITGSAFVAASVPRAQRGSLGSNSLSNGVGYGNALCAEIVMTCVLVLVVLETAVNRKSVARAQAPLAIGFAVVCAHAVLLPLDGCSINPARSLGPAVVSGTWPGTFWIFVVGPLLGALCAVPLHFFFRSDWDTLPSVATRTPDPVSLDSAASGQPPNRNNAGGKEDSPRVEVLPVAESSVAMDIVATADPGLAHSDSLSLAAGGGLSARDEAGRPLPPALAMA